MKFSINIINFNNKEGLRKTIKSEVHQYNQVFESFVFNGGSTVVTTECLDEYNDLIKQGIRTQRTYQQNLWIII